MRIVITVDPYIPVPPEFYGGIERVVDFLVAGLVEAGHEVTLFAHPGSKVPARLVPYGVPPYSSRGARARELWQVGSRLWSMRKQIDIVHSFGRLAALAPVLRHRKIAKIQSYQRNGVPWNSVKIAAKIAKSSIVFTGCSSSVYRDRPGGSSSESQWRTIFNGVDMAKYVFSPAVAVDAPLICLGRVEQIKGVHNAIAIAQAARRRLVIAGNRVDCGPGGRYFETEIAPHLDGRQIEYVGPVNDEQKNRLLGDCAALLMPIEWEEPFGIVMAEAMACGTPVIGFMRGSVPELIRDGVNGFTGRTLEEAVAAVYRLSEIDRRQVRRDCEIRFGSDVIVDAYERLYLEASLK